MKGSCLGFLSVMLCMAACGCGGNAGSSLNPDGDLPWDVDGAPGDAGLDEAGAEGDGAAADAGDAGSPDSAVDGGGPVQQGCITGSFAPYWGNLHSHTGNSDGDGTPAEAFAHARFQAGLDFLAVTDHLEQLYNWLGIPTEEFPDCRQAAADANTDGVFLAICGYEYGSGFDITGSTGHNNVFFVDYLFPVVQLDFHDFYQEVVACPSCVTQFNHPGDSASMTWNDFEYDSAVDAKMNLFEMNGGGPTWDLLFEALDMGWHVSPVHNQDNHSADWGTHDDRRAGVFITSLDRDQLYDALIHRRTFMTRDKNASLRLMGESACWMGSVLTGYSSLDLEASAEDADPGDGFVNIEFYGPGQALLATVDCAGQTTCAATHSTSVPSSTYVLARANQSDGDFLVSAPIWVSP